MYIVTAPLNEGHQQVFSSISMARQYVDAAMNKHKEIECMIILLQHETLVDTIYRKKSEEVKPQTKE